MTVYRYNLRIQTCCSYSVICTCSGLYSVSRVHKSVSIVAMQIGGFIIILWAKMNLTVLALKLDCPKLQLGHHYNHLVRVYVASLWGRMSEEFPQYKVEAVKRLQLYIIGELPLAFCLTDITDVEDLYWRTHEELSMPRCVTWSKRPQYMWTDDVGLAINCCYFTGGPF